MGQDGCELLCLDLPRAEQVRHARPPENRLKDAALAAKLLGDPTRLMLAHALLIGGELCVCDLSWVAERSQALVSHHVRALRAAGLLSSRRDGRMVMCSLTGTGRELVAAVLPELATASS